MSSLSQLPADATRDQSAARKLMSLTAPPNQRPVIDVNAPFKWHVQPGLPDPVGQVGTKVSALLGKGVSDADGDSVGIAITSVSNVNLFYSLDEGLTWLGVTQAVSETSALKLKADALLYFKPQTSSSASIGFRAWDGTDGESGDRSNLNPNYAKLGSLANFDARITEYGKYLLAAHYSGLYVINVDDPNNPTIISTLKDPLIADSGGLPALVSIYVRNDLAYVVNAVRSDSYLYTLSLADLKDIKVVGEKIDLYPNINDSGGLGKVTGRGDTLLVRNVQGNINKYVFDAQGIPKPAAVISATNIRDFEIGDAYIVIGQDAGLRLVDRISNQETILTFSSLGNRDTYDVMDVLLHDSLAIVSTRQGSVMIADLDADGGPAWISQIALQNINGAAFLSMSGSNLFVTPNRGLGTSVIDLSNPYGPKESLIGPKDQWATMYPLGEHMIAFGTGMQVLTTGLLPVSVSTAADLIEMTIRDTVPPVVTLPAQTDAHPSGVSLRVNVSEKATVYLVQADALNGPPTNPTQLVRLVKDKKAIQVSSQSDNSATFDTTGRAGEFVVYALDGANISAPLTQTVTIVAGPALMVPTNPAAFTERDAPLPFASALTLTDSQSLGSGQYTAEARLIPGGQAPDASESLVLTINPATMGSLAATYTAATGTLAITGTGTLAQWQAALKAIQYANTSHTPVASRTIDISFRDTGKNLATQKSVVVQIKPFEDAPTINGVPNLPKIVALDTATSLAGITISDLDSTTLTLTLTPTHGTLTGVTAVDGQFVLSGTAASINAALAQATFTLAQGRSGSLKIQVADSSGKTPTEALYSFSLPIVPSRPELTGNDDTGTAGDRITAKNVVSLSGSAEANGSIVKLYDGTVLVGKGTITDGRWTVITDALNEGLRSLTAKLTTDGIDSNASLPLALTVDRTAPGITRAEAGQTAPIHRVGDTISFTLKSAEPLKVDTTDGEPSLSLVIDGVTRTAGFNATNSDLASGTLAFAYVVQAGDFTQNGLTVASGVSLNGGRITDLAGNDAQLVLPDNVSGASSLRIDAVVPTITKLTAPAAGTYLAGDILRFTLNVSEDVSIAGGSPWLNLAVGNTTRQATYDARESASGKLVFSYVVQTGDQDANGIALGSFNLGGASIRDVTGNDASITLPAADLSAVRVDAVAPTVTAIDAPAAGSYRLGAKLSFTVSVSERIDVNGAPSLALSLGGTSRTAAYDAAASEPATGKLVFKYTVAAGDTSAAATITGLSVVPGSIADLAGNALAIALPGNMNTAGIVIDGIVPLIKSFSLQNSPLKLNDARTVLITAGDTGDRLELVSGSVAGYALRDFAQTDHAPDQYVATFTANGESGDVAADEDLPVVLKLRDKAGNESTYDTPLSQDNDSIDVTLPHAGSSAIIARDVDRNGTYSSGDTIVLTFSEPVVRKTIREKDVFIGGKSLEELGASIRPLADTDADAREGVAFVITIGTTAVPADDRLTIAAERIIDAAGNQAGIAVSTALPSLPALPSPSTPTTPQSPAQTAAFDGVLVQVGNGADGQQQITIPVFNETRSEDVNTPNSELADVPLVTNSAGVPLLSAGVPAGTGLRINGPAAMVSGSTARSVLDSRIASASGTTEQHASAQLFLSSLPADTQVVVQTVTVTAQSVAGSPLVISAATQGNNQRTAVVIDTRALPASTLIDLNNIDFAVIVGNARVTGGAGANIAYGDDDNQFIVLGDDNDVLHGQGGTDTVGSLRGKDRIFGDAGNDVVYGGTNHDVLEGGAGSDQLNGGFGLDTAVQGGTLADYTVTLDGATVVLTHKTSGEIDRLLDVEVVNFASGQGLVIAHEASDVAALTAAHPTAQLIELNLNRAVAGTTGDDTITPELGIALNIDLGDGQDVVKMAGRRDDVNLAVEAGNRVELTRLVDGAMLAFNNVEAIAFDRSEVTVLAHNHNEAIIGRAYELVLNRNVDTEGYGFWVKATQAGSSLQSVLSSILESSEFTGTHAGLSNADFTGLLYQNGLNRAADADGKAFWVGALDAGVSRAQILESIAASAEAVSVIGSTIDVTLVS